MMIAQILCPAYGTVRSTFFILNLNFLWDNFCLLHLLRLPVASFQCAFLRWIWLICLHILSISCVESKKIFPSSFSSPDWPSSLSWFSFPVLLHTCSVCWTCLRTYMSFCPKESRIGYSTPDVLSRVSSVPSRGEGSLYLNCCCW